MSMYDDFFEFNGFDPHSFDSDSVSALDRFMKYINDLIQEKPEYKSEFPTVYDWATRYVDKYADKNIKKDTPESSKKNEIPKIIQKDKTDKLLDKIDKTDKTDKTTPTTTPRATRFSETLTREKYDDITTSGIKPDQETSVMRDKIPNYDNFNSSRVSVFGVLNNDELNSKVNYILQYFFSCFSNKLDEARKDTTVKMITINLEPPVYNKDETNSYKVVMNTEAHKKAVKMIHNFLNNKGYDKHDISHIVETSPNFYGGSTNSPQLYGKVTEKYVIEISLSK